MKNFKKIVFLSFTMSLMLSCGVAKINTAKTKDVNGPGVTHLPVLADLDVRSTKVSASANGLLKPPMVTKESIKKEAIAEALAKVNGDVLIEPFYKIENVGKRYTVTVTGYPATYKNFRMMEEKDTTLFYVMHPKPGIKNTTNTSTETINDSKSKVEKSETEKKYETFGKVGERSGKQKKNILKVVLLTWGAVAAVVMSALLIA